MDSKDFGDKYTENYKEQNRWQYYWYRWLVNTIIEETRGDKVLDLGVGHGILPKNMPDKHFIGVDASPGMIKYAEKLENVECMVSYIEDLEFEAETFDSVISNLALDHVEDQEKLAKKVYKWLRPGGKYVIGLHFKPTEDFMSKVKNKINNYPDNAEKFNQSLKEFFDNAPEDYGEDRVHEYLFTTEEMKGFLEKAGFKVKVIPSYNERFAMIVGEK